MQRTMEGVWRSRIERTCFTCHQHELTVSLANGASKALGNFIIVCSIFGAPKKGVERCSRLSRASYGGTAGKRKLRGGEVGCREIHDALGDVIRHSNLYVRYGTLTCAR